MKRRQEYPAHLSFIRSLPPLVRGHGSIDAAHLRFADALYGKEITGMQRKPSDAWTVPLPHAIHMSQHAAGDERAWWTSEGINPLIIAALLFVHSGDDKAGAIIIRNARAIAPW